MIIPIRDHNPSRRFPFVTYALLAINILIFLAHQGFSERETALFYYTWGMIPAEVTSGIDLFTLFTSIFLHGGWMHLLGNMLYLWIFGDNMEDAWGHGKFLLFYVACGILASTAQIAWNPASSVPNIGASGAIAGVLGGYLLMYPKARVDVLFFIRLFPIPAWIVLGIWLGMQFFNGLTVDASGGGVAYWAHAGGFVAGAIICIPIWLKHGAFAFWTRTEGHPPHPATQYTRTRVPKVRKR